MTRKELHTNGPLPAILVGLIAALPIAACTATPIRMATPTLTAPPPSSTPTQIPPSPTQTPFQAPTGACANVLWPLLPGSEWVFQTSGAESQNLMTFRVTDITGELASFEAFDQNSGVTTPDTARCQDGALLNLPLITQSLLLSDFLDGVLNTYQSAGLSAPNYQTFEENQWAYTWQVEKLIEQPIKVQMPGLESAYILQNTRLVIHSATDGLREPVEVPAGSFSQALLVSNELRVPVTIGNSSAILTVQYLEWYQPYVGLLKIQTEAASLDFSGIPMPFPLERTLELVEYQSGTP
jgi:hypothetical protein